MSAHDYPRLPTVITSSVIRSTHQGESHGGVYIVDMETGSFEQVIDWNDASINWEGRGLDRGLRGIAFHCDHVYIAASNEIFVYDQQFKLLESYRNRYLKHCHEICIAGNTLFLTSTGFDSVLVFDLVEKVFTLGYCLRFNAAENKLDFYVFDPNEVNGPAAGDSIHVNSVFYQDGRLFVSSLRSPFLFYITDNTLSRFCPIPNGTHNARPFGEGVLLNDTAKERLLSLSRTGMELNAFPVVRYRDEDLAMSDLPRDHARQAFARGLCVSSNGWIIGGSSPSTISAYRLDNPDSTKSVNLTMDIRNSIHGLEIWPF